MINAVSSTTAVNSTTAVARPQAEESAARRAGVESSVATTLPTAAAPVVATQQSTVVSISEQALTRTADVAVPAKPDWSFAPQDGNKDGRITFFEQQFYDIRNFPSSLQQVLDLQANAVPPPPQMVKPAVPEQDQPQRAAPQERVQAERVQQQQQQPQKAEAPQPAQRSAASADLKAYEDVARTGQSGG